jgi:DNA-binding transcriptional regulator YdaS (Cro superfamily)
MKTADAVALFGSQSALARALGIRPAAVAQWGETVPSLRQLQIQQLTLGKLKAADDVFERLQHRG